MTCSLGYLKGILDDRAVSDTEQQDFGLLKLIFKIEEGDFYKHRYDQTKEIIEDHLKWIFADDVMPPEEALESVNLQTMFNLSYDQYFDFEKHFISKYKEPTKATKPPITAKGKPAPVQDEVIVRPSIAEHPSAIAEKHIAQQTIHQQRQTNLLVTEHHKRHEAV